MTKFFVGMLVRYKDTGLVAGEIVKIRPDKMFGTLYYVSGGGEKMIPYERHQIEPVPLYAVLERARKALELVETYVKQAVDQTTAQEQGWKPEMFDDHALIEVYEPQIADTLTDIRRVLKETAP